MTSSNPDVPSLEQVLTAFYNLQEEVASLKAKTKKISTSSDPVKINSTPELPKIAIPEKYDGNRAKFRGFVNQCRLVFTLQPQRYPNDIVKIGFIVSLLKGSALDWASPLLEKDNDVMNDFDKFLHEFRRVFDDPDRKRTAENALQSLVQGRRSAATYASDFRRLITDVDWNESAQIHHFRTGLNEDVKDDLARIDRHPETISDFIDLCIRIDNRLYERRHERKLVYYGSKSSSANSSKPRQYQKTTFSNVRSPVASYHSNQDQPSSDPSPMQIDATRPFSRTLSTKEKQRRMSENLCMYCGAPGHKINDCSIRPQKSTTIPSSNTAYHKKTAFASVATSNPKGNEDVQA